MNDTKRKFNALLQGIGARSSQQVSQPESTLSGLYSTASNNSLTRLSTVDRPSTPTSQTDTPPSTSMAPIASPSISSDYLSKRRRIGIPESITSNQFANSPSISSVTLRKLTPTGSVGGWRKDGKSDPPKYCPGDRAELIRRLSTFQDLTVWTPKPEKVSEIEWAKKGWICQGKERVRCELCHKEAVVNANKRQVEGKEVPVVMGSDIEEALIKKFAELITEAHQEDCPWRKHGCDDSLLRMPLANPEAALKGLRERYDDLCTRPAFLPYRFNLRLPEALDLDAVKAQLTPSFFNDPAPQKSDSSTPSDVALALALTGWQGLTNPRIGAVPNTATCTTCLRRLGLWLFKSREIDESTGRIISPAPMDCLDPVREHRFFCPWRNPSAQHNPGSKVKDNKTAWEVLAQTIKNHSYLREQAEKSSKRRNSIWHRHRGSTASGKSGKSVPGTPTKEDTEGENGLVMLGPDMVDDDDDEDPSARDAKDKERWARLRRVKSLFNTKNGKKLQRTLSRPDTASSRPGTGHSRQSISVDDRSGEKDAGAS
ncbi:C3HC zinc finger-like-domain-containing protein [Xylariomycetidae sp. FL0641]|nr:C3HC zinc finger-like-domain-containing protein [Xylariomycetidae sp. FL0641]